MTIYKSADGSYYYSEHRQNKDDEKIEARVSVDYAFEYCERKNFGGHTNISSKKSKPICKYINENWQRELHAFAELYI